MDSSPINYSDTLPQGLVTPLSASVSHIMLPFVAGCWYNICHPKLDVITSKMSLHPSESVFLIIY